MFDDQKKHFESGTDVMKETEDRNQESGKLSLVHPENDDEVNTGEKGREKDQSVFKSNDYNDAVQLNSLSGFGSK